MLEGYILFNCLTTKFCGKFYSLKDLRSYGEEHRLDPRDCIVLKCMGDNSWEGISLLPLENYCFLNISYKSSSLNEVLEIESWTWKTT
jgi:hypothetical protein